MKKLCGQNKDLKRLVIDDLISLKVSRVLLSYHKSVVIWEERRSWRYWTLEALCEVEAVLGLGLLLHDELPQPCSIVDLGQFLEFQGSKRGIISYVYWSCER